MNNIYQRVGERISKSLVVVVAMTVLGGSVGHSAFGQPTYYQAASSAVISPSIRLARWIGLMIAHGVASEMIMSQVKSVWKQLYPNSEFTEANFQQAYRAGLIALQQAKSDPSPSLADCQFDLFKAVNPHCN